MSPEDDQYEIEYPEEDYPGFYEVEDLDHYSYFYNDPVDIEWDYEDEENVA